LGVQTKKKKKEKRKEKEKIKKNETEFIVKKVLHSSQNACTDSEVPIVTAFDKTQLPKFCFQLAIFLWRGADRINNIGEVIIKIICYK
jgi:hypothetical protein